MTDTESFLGGKVVLRCGDCLDVLKTLDANSVDSVVCDPPYGIGFMGKDWDKFSATHKMESNNKPGGWSFGGAPGAVSKRFYEGGPAFQLWMTDWAKEVIRVLKPGAHLLSFGGTRTYHRMACAIEDAGFEIRDSIQWLYGSGFPKSLDVSKAIDKSAGVEFESAPASGVGFMGPDRPGGYNRTIHQLTRVGEATDAAREWKGYGTALKPACEPIVLARKPLSESTVAANVLKWGTGALNIDGCRVGIDEVEREIIDGRSGSGESTEGWGNIGNRAEGQRYKSHNNGRWPANVIHDGSDEVVGMFPESESTRSVVTSKPGSVYGMGAGLPSHTGEYGFNDSGSAARFFYTAKADADDRLGSKHPTVKPLDLMQYLVRLVTPKGGLVLDCFAGTGTTGEAAWREGMRAVLIEREPEYQNDIRRRMALCLAGPAERERESIKARMKDKPVDHGPLFGGTDESRGGQTDNLLTNTEGGGKYAAGRSKSKFFVALDPLAPKG